jgi:hypothetical protein
MPVLEWMAMRGDMPYAPDVEACVAAADNGQLTALRWLRARGCPLSPRVFVSAVECGHLDMLRWLRGQGCRWPPLRCISEARDVNKPWLEQWLRDCYDADLASGRVHLLADGHYDDVDDPPDSEADDHDANDTRPVDWFAAINPDDRPRSDARALEPWPNMPMVPMLDLEFEHIDDDDAIAHSQNSQETEEQVEREEQDAAASSTSSSSSAVAYPNNSSDSAVADPNSNGSSLD